MGVLEDYWNNLRLLRKEPLLTEEDMQWFKEMTEACEKAEREE